MAIEDEIINITDIDVGTEILNNDKLIIETNSGTKLLAFKDLVIGEDNITFKDKLIQGAGAAGGSSTDTSIVTGYNILTSDTTAGHVTKYSDVSGSVELGKFNYDRVAKFAELSATIIQNQTSVNDVYASLTRIESYFQDPAFIAAGLPAPTLSAVNFFYENGSYDQVTRAIKFTSDNVVVDPTKTNTNTTVIVNPFSVTYPSAGEGYVGSYILFQLDVSYRKIDAPTLEIHKTNSTGTTPVWKYNVPRSGPTNSGRFNSFTHIQYVEPGDKISVTSTSSLTHIHFKGFKLAS